MVVLGAAFVQAVVEHGSVCLTRLRKVGDRVVWWGCEMEVVGEESRGQKPPSGMRDAPSSFPPLPSMPLNPDPDTPTYDAYFVCV